MSKPSNGGKRRAEQSALLPRRTKSQPAFRPGKARSLTPLTKYGILKRDYMEEHEPSLYLGLTLIGEIHNYLLTAQEAAEALRDRLTAELPKIIPMPEEAKMSFLARVRYENWIEQTIHEIILEEIIYEVV